MRTGDTAPNFELADETGTARRLTDLLADGPVVLFFYPAAMTKGCTQESCHFRDLAGEFAEVGAQRVGISADAVEKQHEFATRHSLGYPLLSDPDRSVAAAYGVKRGLAMLPNRRATFVIDTDGTVLEVVRSEINMDAHADKALAALRGPRLIGAPGPGMRRPVVLTVDDDPAVLGAVQRDLRSRYAEQWRVMAAASGQEALEALKELRLRGDPVALLLVDQRMPGMSGVELVAAAQAVHPDAKRVLLTAYADTDAAIAAINEVHADHYLLKPWDPPTERLYPVLDELLDEWLAGFRPPFEGVRVVAPQWSPPAHRLKEFLGRNRIPYRSLDAEGSPEAAELLGSTGPDTALPLVVLPDGRVLADPDVADVAAAVGMRTRSELPLYDLVVVGGGPAGLAAAVYGASEGLRTLLVEGEAVGGQAGTSSRIENYLGFPQGVSGTELARRARDQAVRLHAELLVPCQATALRVEDGYKLVALGNGDEVNARALVVAGGVSYRRLEAQSCDRLTGAGVYYGAAHSEAVDVSGADVVVVGGANSAGQAAVKLAERARTATLLVRSPSIDAGMSSYLVDQVEALANVEVRTEVEVAAVSGEDHLESITVRDRRSGATDELRSTAMFVFIGAQPHTSWLDGVVARDDHGFLPTGPDLSPSQLGGWPLERPPYLLETNVPGLFAAGDVRQGSVKRVASAVGEGAVAVTFVHRYLA